VKWQGRRDTSLWHASPARIILHDYNRGRSMVAKLECVALREALPQRVVECAALEIRLQPSQPAMARSAQSCFL
jgi:hypothetical protein